MAVLGPIRSSAARQELDTSITALTTHATVQGSPARNITAQLNNERAIESSLRNAHMKPIATFARARLRGSPNIAALTRVPKQVRGARLVHAARAMATAARAAA